MNTKKNRKIIYSLLSFSTLTTFGSIIDMTNNQTFAHNDNARNEQKKTAAANKFFLESLLNNNQWHELYHRILSISIPNLHKENVSFNDMSYIQELLQKNIDFFGLNNFQDQVNNLNNNKYTKDVFDFLNEFKRQLPEKVLLYLEEQNKKFPEASIYSTEKLKSFLGDTLQDGNTRVNEEISHQNDMIQISSLPLKTEDNQQFIKQTKKKHKIIPLSNMIDKNSLDNFDSVKLNYLYNSIKDIYIPKPITDIAKEQLNDNLSYNIKKIIMYKLYPYLENYGLEERLEAIYKKMAHDHNENDIAKPQYNQNDYDILVSAQKDILKRIDSILIKQLPDKTNDIGLEREHRDVMTKILNYDIDTAIKNSDDFLNSMNPVYLRRYNQLMLRLHQIDSNMIITAFSAFIDNLADDPKDVDFKIYNKSDKKLIEDDFTKFAMKYFGLDTAYESKIKEYFAYENYKPMYDYIIPDYYKKRYQAAKARQYPQDFIKSNIKRYAYIQELNNMSETDFIEHVNKFNHHLEYNHDHHQGKQALIDRMNLSDKLKIISEISLDEHKKQYTWGKFIQWFMSMNAEILNVETTQDRLENDFNQITEKKISAVLGKFSSIFDQFNTITGNPSQIISYKTSDNEFISKIQFDDLVGLFIKSDNYKPDTYKYSLNYNFPDIWNDFLGFAIKKNKTSEDKKSSYITMLSTYKNRFKNLILRPSEKHGILNTEDKYKPYFFSNRNIDPYNSSFFYEQALHFIKKIQISDYIQLPENKNPDIEDRYFDNLWDNFYKYIIPEYHNYYPSDLDKNKKILNSFKPKLNSFLKHIINQVIQRTNHELDTINHSNLFNTRDKYFNEYKKVFQNNFLDIVQAEATLLAYPPDQSEKTYITNIPIQMTRKNKNQLDKYVEIHKNILTELADKELALSQLNIFLKNPDDNPPLDESLFKKLEGMAITFSYHDKNSYRLYLKENAEYLVNEIIRLKEDKEKLHKEIQRLRSLSSVEIEYKKTVENDSEHESDDYKLPNEYKSILYSELKRQLLRSLLPNGRESSRKILEKKIDDYLSQQANPILKIRNLYDNVRAIPEAIKEYRNSLIYLFSDIILKSSDGESLEKSIINLSADIPNNPKIDNKNYENIRNKLLESLRRANINIGKNQSELIKFILDKAASAAEDPVSYIISLLDIFDQMNTNYHNSKKEENDIFTKSLNYLKKYQDYLNELQKENDEKDNMSAALLTGLALGGPVGPATIISELVSSALGGLAGYVSNSLVFLAGVEASVIEAGAIEASETTIIENIETSTIEVEETTTNIAPKSTETIEAKLPLQPSEPNLVNDRLLKNPELNPNLAPQEIPEPNPNLAPQEIPEPNPNLAPQEIPEPNPNLAPQEIPEPNPNPAPQEIPEPNPNPAPQEIPEPNPNPAPQEIPEPNPPNQDMLEEEPEEGYGTEDDESDEGDDAASDISDENYNYPDLGFEDLEPIINLPENTPPIISDTAKWKSWYNIIKLRYSLNANIKGYKSYKSSLHNELKLFLPSLEIQVHEMIKKPSLWREFLIKYSKDKPAYIIKRINTFRDRARYYYYNSCYEDYKLKELERMFKKS